MCFALLKLASAGDSVAILHQMDRVTGLSNKQLLILAGAMEWLAALYCVLGRSIAVRGLILLCLNVVFYAYKALAYLSDFREPGQRCPCLGFAGSWLSLSASQEQTILVLASIAFIGVGVYALVTELRTGDNSDNRLTIVQK